jgi:hypothetical protein
MLVLAEVDVVVELHGCLAKAAHPVGGWRKGLQHRRFDLSEALSARNTKPLHWPVVQLFELLGDRLIEVVKRSENPPVYQGNG